MTEVLQVHYDGLASLSQQLEQEGESMSVTLRDIQAALNELENGGWRGEAANAFYAEMHEQVVPEINRIMRAVDGAGKFLRHASQKVSEAEDQLKPIFQQFA